MPRFFLIDLISEIPARGLAQNYEGRLQIESVDIDVMIMEPPSLPNTVPFSKVLNSSIFQFVVDKSNCAAFSWIDAHGYIPENAGYGSFVVADHSGENFSTLKDCTVGSFAKITRPDGFTTEYVVTDIFMGVNVGQDLQYDSGGSVLKDNPGGIILYTCADETQVPVHIVFLQPVE